MKQLCKNCGRRFDGDLTDGICPYCGSIASQPVPDSSADPEILTDPEPEEAPEMEPQPERQPEPKPSPKVQPQKSQPAPAAAAAAPATVTPPWVRWLPWAMSLILAVAIVVTTALKPVLTHRAMAQRQEDGFVPTGECTLGTITSVGDQQRSIELGQAQWVEHVRGVQEDAVLVRIYCKMGDRKQHTKGQEQWLYLEVDGMFYPQVDTYYLEEFYPNFSENVYDAYSIGNNSMREGWLCFVVPKGTQKATLWMQESTVNDWGDVLSSKFTGQEFELEKEETLE